MNEGVMARCDSCGTSILFGGVRDGDRRFCNENCRQAGMYLPIADQIPEEMVDEFVRRIHDGPCPKCQGPGPVDVHVSHTVWSALVLTSWRSRPEICCSSCGTRARLGAAASSALLGWWGFPFGIVLTPVQIVRNLAGLFSTPDPLWPSAELERLGRMSLAAQIAEAHRQAKPGA
jgi:hypothetical protein